MNIFLEKAIELILSLGKGSAKKGLNDAFQKNPHLTKQMMLALYPVIDVQLENYTLHTGNKLDDKAVKTIKEIIEEVASENGLELPNLDQD